VVQDDVGAGEDVDASPDVGGAEDDVAVEVSVDDEVVDAVAVDVAGRARVGELLAGLRAVDFEGVGGVGRGAAGRQVEARGIGRRRAGAGISQRELKIFAGELSAAATAPTTLRRLQRLAEVDAREPAEAVGEDEIGAVIFIEITWGIEDIGAETG
jgi:hypothetical protein